MKNAETINSGVFRVTYVGQKCSQNREEKRLLGMLERKKLESSGVE